MQTVKKRVPYSTPFDAEIAELKERLKRLEWMRRQYICLPGRIFT